MERLGDTVKTALRPAKEISAVVLKTGSDFVSDRLEARYLGRWQQKLIRTLKLLLSLRQ